MEYGARIASSVPEVWIIRWFASLAHEADGLLIRPYGGFGGIVMAGRTSELTVRILRLEAELVQLRARKARKSRPRPLDFSAFNYRYVALKIAYLGHRYQGYASQSNTENTVEAHLFEALRQTRLVQSKEKTSYHRCGRTDRGVSAMGQVISLYLRSNMAEGLGVKPSENGVARTSENEIPYAYILNKVLPYDIRILSWAPVPPEFNARFSCLSRTYRYVFPRGRLDVERIAAAAQLFEGTHDFRNFCRPDIGGRKNLGEDGGQFFKRTILHAKVFPLEAEVDKEIGENIGEVKKTSPVIYQVDHGRRDLEATLGCESSKLNDLGCDAQKGELKRKPDETMEKSKLLENTKPIPDKMPDHFRINEMDDILKKSYPGEELRSMRKGHLQEDCNGFDEMEVETGDEVIGFPEKLQSGKSSEQRDLKVEGNGGLSSKGLKSGSGFDLFVFEVRGHAFLYHQVRCMMAILLHVGSSHEDPSVVSKLLDVEENPRKPQYTMAPDSHLILHSCEFESMEWQDDINHREYLIGHFQRLWTEQATHCALIGQMLLGLGETQVRHQDEGLMETRSANHRPLLSRPLGPSIPDRIRHQAKRRRLEKDQFAAGDDKQSVEGGDGDGDGEDDDEMRIRMRARARATLD
uniref:tRNA pseudouridine(38/39) synthase n=1 Tax=Myxine glutinosa TaxID=7769 RepID=UPI0035900805